MREGGGASGLHSWLAAGPVSMATGVQAPSPGPH